MSKTRRTRSPNADLVEAARSHRDQILMFHDQRGGTQPVILLDFQRLRLRSYPFEEYKATVCAGIAGDAGRGIREGHREEQSPRRGVG